MRRALRPHDGRTAVFVAGSPTLHKFIASRFSSRTDIWVAQPLSARNNAQGTVYRMKPDVTIVDLDPIWNPAGLPLARAVTEACPVAHVILVAPEGYPQGPMVASAAVDPGWSAVLRRKVDDGEQLVRAMVAGLGGDSWIDPGLTGADWRETAEEPGGPESGDERGWEDGVADGAIERAGAIGSVSEDSVMDAEVDDWRARARKGIRH